MNLPDDITDPAQYLAALASGLLWQCDVCGQDFQSHPRNVYDGGYQVACDECLVRYGDYFLGVDMDPSPQMQTFLNDQAGGVVPCVNCKELVRQIGETWRHIHAARDMECWTGDGAKASPELGR